MQFTYDLIASLLLFFLIYQFYVQSKKKYVDGVTEENELKEIGRFIQVKKILATLLVPVLIFVAIYSFLQWFLGTINSSTDGNISFKNINNIFFEQFFTILIVADVILLLFSFFHTDQFHKVIRNSGFIISTILIRLSFATSGLLNTLLILSAIVFGLLILIIFNKFEKKISEEKRRELIQ